MTFTYDNTSNGFYWGEPEELFDFYFEMYIDNSLSASKKFLVNYRQAESIFKTNLRLIIDSYQPCQLKVYSYDVIWSKIDNDFKTVRREVIYSNPSFEKLYPGKFK